MTRADESWRSVIEPKIATATRAASVFVEVPSRDKPMTWPLVLAPLDDDARAMIDRLVAPSAPDWIRKLVRPATERDELASIAIATAPSASVTKTNAAVAIMISPVALASLKLDVLELATESAVTARTDPGDPIEWLVHFIAELSHDWPLDIAFARANEQARSSSWAEMYANPEDLQESRISAFAERTLREANAVRRAKPPIDLASLGVVVEQLDHQLENATWDHESGDASKIVEHAAELARLTKMSNSKAPNGAKPDPEARRLSAACVRGEGASMRVRPTAPLAAGAEGYVEVDVRAPQLDRATHPLAMPDIISGEPDKDEFDLDVFWISSLGTQSGKLRLPRSGASNRKVFRYCRPADSAKLTVLVVLMYAQRLVQAGELEINADTHEVSWRETILVQRALDQVKASSAANAAATIASDGATTFALGSDEPKILAGMHTPQAGVVSESLRRALGRASASASTRGVLSDDDFRAMLIDVAKAGVILYGQILSKAVRGAEHVQLIERSAGSWFPVEFVYEHAAPLPEARVCDREVDMSQHGCDAGCRARADGRNWVCPRSFWGTSKTIERWSLRDVSDRRAPSASSDPLVFCSPSGPEREIDVLSEGLAAFSRLVSADTRAAIDELCKKTKGGATTNGWRGVAERVRRTNPGLHIVLAHHEQEAEDGYDALEVDNDLRTVPYIDEEVVGGGARRPLVLLLACNSLSPDAGIAGPAQQYLSNGAAAVVGTTTLVWAPVVARVVFDLARALCRKDARVRLSEWLRQSRLRLLAKGDATAFSLVAYGDADWVLRGTELDWQIPDGALSRDADDDAARPLREKKPSKRRAGANT
ncbi:MAG: hypothetical protein JNK05_30695 [Myxococcales bacterium]|nr:hypothetical protein [Myxococcales bacterium]